MEQDGTRLNRQWGPFGDHGVPWSPMVSKRGPMVSKHSPRRDPLGLVHQSRKILDAPMNTRYYEVHKMSNIFGTLGTPIFSALQYFGNICAGTGGGRPSVLRKLLVLWTHRTYLTDVRGILSYNIS